MTANHVLTVPQSPTSLAGGLLLFLKTVSVCAGANLDNQWSSGCLHIQAVISNSHK